MNKAVALNWINGEWVNTANHKTSFNPANGEQIGSYADAGLSEASAAITAAKNAFVSSNWKTDRMLRAKVLNEMADAFERNTPALIEQLVAENGKVAYEAGFEVSMCAAKLRYCASLVRTLSGRAIQPDDGRFSFVLREPIGVAGVIVPWNSPVVLLIRSIAPALAAGCTIVAKMPSQTALTNSLVAKVIAEAPSLPKGVVNIFNESGSEGAKLIVDSIDVPVISYTGSTHVGRAIASAGGQALKRLNLELGGKSPMILFDDADLGKALPTLEKAITVFAGQFCMAGSRILVQKGIAEQVREGLAKRLTAVKPGPGNDPTSDMGPMIDKANVARVNAAVEDAIAKGAKVIVRGGLIEDGVLAKGAFYKPTLLEVTDGNADIVQTETFGPVAVMQVFETEQEAIELANQTEFGLAASVWSRDVDRPWRIGQKINAGTIWANQWAVIYDESEEGGFKQSGIGRLNGMGSIDVFTEYKHYVISPGVASGN